MFNCKSRIKFQMEKRMIASLRWNEIDFNFHSSWTCAFFYSSPFALHSVHSIEDSRKMSSPKLAKQDAIDLATSNYYCAFRACKYRHIFFATLSGERRNSGDGMRGLWTISINIFEGIQMQNIYRLLYVQVHWNECEEMLGSECRIFFSRKIIMMTRNRKVATKKQ